ncbi:hypothetical protein C8E05_0910 [Rhodococcus wratislaviensis]|uniref:Uncharacterized protein n=1 Tax=Rhodococcus wratislaviensis TaxID=44752 RepID=A0AB38FG00_RHOWR|nr:hypothetical protein [Rhodococcus wratislaviensis]REE71540.1 hypothetical protein C8E05_0910 [Rhodococcus wratislaviensis]SPZ40476.1 Uncharacterised protein [Rhodococcus wratislaviensis]
MTAMEPDHDTAQARIFLDALRAEIEILTQRIANAHARAQWAQDDDDQYVLAERFRAEVPLLREQLLGARRMADRLMLRYPALGDRGDASAR